MMLLGKTQEPLRRGSLTRHSVCPQLIVVDEAKHHECYKGDDVRSVKDLHTSHN